MVILTILMWFDDVYRTFLTNIAKIKYHKYREMKWFV